VRLNGESLTQLCDSYFTVKKVFIMRYLYFFTMLIFMDCLSNWQTMRYWLLSRPRWIYGLISELLPKPTNNG
jgi:L-asparagine transporter-like permease